MSSMVNSRSSSVVSGSVAESEAPGRISRLVDTLRSKEESTRERETFKEFETKVISNTMNRSVRVSTFFDEAILPRASSLASPAHSALIDGLSPLEIIFDFFAGRQQPGTSGVSANVTFEQIAKDNTSMSFSELLKFASMMFAPHYFTRQEVQWVMTKSKTDRFAEVEGNWHGDQGGDLKQMNFVEFLSCVVRLSLICFGSLGKTPEEGAGETAKLLSLTDLPTLKARLVRIARTNGGFGGWREPVENPEMGAQTSISQKRPKALQDLMLTRPGMMDVQHALLAYTHKSNGPSWRAFGGNFISMVVPVTKEGESHKFQILVQSTSQKPMHPECDLASMPFAFSRYYPSSDKGVAPGMECTFDVFCELPRTGEYTGSIKLSDVRSGISLGSVQVYLRAVLESESASMRALSSANSRAPTEASPSPGGDHPQSANNRRSRKDKWDMDTWSPPPPGFLPQSGVPRTRSIPVAGLFEGTVPVGLLGRSASAMSLCSKTGKFRNPNLTMKDLIAPVPVKTPKTSFTMPLVHPTQRKAKGSSVMRHTDLAPLAHRPGA